MEELLNLLSTSRMQIVELINRQGPADVTEIARSLDLAKTTVRQHLSHLEERHLVASQSISEGPGRPRLRYQLTETGHKLFPSQDGPLFGTLIEFLLREGYPGVVDDFFRQMWKQRREELAREMEKREAVELPERLEVLEEFLERQGFSPSVEIDAAGVTIRECNCPFSEGVRATRLPCRLEAQFLSQALQREGQRVQYIPDGKPSCNYLFPHESTSDSSQEGCE